LQGKRDVKVQIRTVRVQWSGLRSVDFPLRGVFSLEKVIRESLRADSNR
jgi:hypothetical protein